MAQSVLISFAALIRNCGYNTRMWENGFTADDVNQVCHELTRWIQTEVGIPGEFVMLWTERSGILFSGDSELVFTTGGEACLVPNPFIEGDSEGFVTAVNRIQSGLMSELYPVQIQCRVLYNAV